MQHFIKAAFSGGLPLVGVCFGHQLIAQTLGGRVQLAEEGWLLGLHEIDVHAHKPWMRGGASTHPLYFINQDQVVELPPDVELLASAPKCPHAMYGIDGRLLSLQAHPEQPLTSMQTFTRLLLDEYHVDQALADAALATMAAAEPHASLFAGWISEFLADACQRDRRG